MPKGIAMNKSSKYIVALQACMVASTLILAGCGGGGGGSTTSANSGSSSGSGSNTPTPVVNTCANGAVDYPSCAVAPQANIVTTVASPTYASGSVQLQAFNELNTIRKSLGLGLLSQNAFLDTSSTNHLNYLQIFPTAGHVETASTAGFTGVLPSDRATYAGYQKGSTVLEALGYSNPVDLNGKFISPVSVLMGTVYHRSGLLQQWITDVGFAALASGGVINSSPMVVDYSSTAKQNNSPTYTLTYPASGQVNVQTTMWPEVTNPVPSIAHPGYPVSFASAAGTLLKVNSFTLTQSGSTTPLAVTYLDAANGPYINLLGANEAFIVPNAPLSNGTTYSANITGTIT